MQFPSDLLSEDVCWENEFCWGMNYVQGSEKWLAARRGGIGGTGIYTIMGLSEYTTLDQYEASCECPVPVAITVPMKRGLQAEKYMREMLEKQFGIKIIELGMGVSKTHPFMRASPDGIYVRNDGTIGIVEMKTISKKTKTATYNRVKDQMFNTQDPDTTCIFEDHYHQMQYTAGIFGATEIIYCALSWSFNSYHRGKQEPFFYIEKIPVDNDLFEGTHIPVASNFWQKIAPREQNAKFQQPSDEEIPVKI